MKKYLLLLVLIASAIYSQDDLKFEMVKISKVYTNPASQSDTLFTYLLEYPKFDESGKSASLAKFLNKAVTSLYLDPLAKGKSDYEYNLANYKDFVKDIEKGIPAMSWYFEKKIEYSSPVSGVGTLTYSGYQYSGGAHGGSWVYYVNYDLKKQKKLTLADVLNKNYDKTLTATGEKFFRKLKGLAPGASLEGEYWFDGNKFHLNDNFLFTKNGIVFYFNEYEITCYACGTTELAIPWGEIKSLISKKGPLGQLAN